jgi:hypothetical protein
MGKTNMILKDLKLSELTPMGLLAFSEIELLITTCTIVCKEMILALAA